MRPKRNVRSIFQRFEKDDRTLTPGLGSQTFPVNSDRNKNNSNNGVLSIMEHLNDATVRNQADLVTTTCDLKAKIKRLDQRLSSKINDAATRQEILEILFEQQESDVEYLKSLMKFTLDSLISLYNGAISMASMNGSPSGSIMALTNYVPPEVVQEHEEEQQQSPSTSPPANDHDDDDQWTMNTAAINAMDTIPPPQDNDVKLFNIPSPFKCEFCQRSFTTQRNLNLHIDRKPKICKRPRIQRLSTGRGRKGTGFYYDHDHKLH